MSWDLLWTLVMIWAPYAIGKRTGREKGRTEASETKIMLMLDGETIGGIGITGAVIMPPTIKRVPDDDQEG